MYIMICTLPFIVSAFVPNLKDIKPTVKNFKYYGDLPPLNFFDPLKLSNTDNSQYLREFELQHGRVAMVASVLLPLIELTNPDTLSIDFLANMDFAQQLPVWYLMVLLEFGRMKTAWQNPFTNGTFFSLKEDFQPGNYLNINTDKISERRFNSELNNGRLAMLASAHIIGSELLTRHPLF